MPRRAEFDREEILDRAMRLFWRQGYEATSVGDLVRAMRINRASMYAAFGDKRGLFLAAIDRYLARVNADRLTALVQAPSVRAGLAAYFDGLVKFSLGEGKRLGCLLTNTAVELSGRDRAVAAKIDGVFGHVEETFYGVIRRGQEAGEIAADKDARALARFLLTTVQGLRVLARGRAEARVLNDAARIALEALD